MALIWRGHTQLAKMTGFLQPLAAAWAILKGGKERNVDLLRVTQRNTCQCPDLKPKP
jgi:hypothetical protein